MGVRAIYERVRQDFQAVYPSVQFLYTAEAREFQTAPPMIIWELPEPGGEEFSRQQLGPSSASDAVTKGRLLWTRTVAVNIHVWMPSGGVDSDGCEYPADNEDRTQGEVWLVEGILSAISRACPGQYIPTFGGWGPRTAGNLGFLYILQVKFLLPVFDCIQNLQVAEITTTDQSVSY
jgi:hypothetical protein